MLMDCRDGSWTNVQGQRLSLPVTKELADKVTLVESTGKDRPSHGTCHVDADGRPHLCFPFGANVRYYRWDGKAWQKPVMVAAGQGRVNDGDFVVDSPTTVRMILGLGNPGLDEVGWWKTTDGGLNWVKDPVLISSPSMGFQTSVIIRNAHPDAQMLLAAMLANEEHLYRRMYLVGEHGPLGRPEAEASHLGDRLEQLKLLPRGTPKAEAKRKKKARQIGEEP